jgi:hypothetical protein
VNRQQLRALDRELKAGRASLYDCICFAGHEVTIATFALEDPDCREDTATCPLCGESWQAFALQR